MCLGTPTAHELFIQRPQVPRQDSGISLPSEASVGSTMASRPWSALQKGNRPLSAKKPPRRPISAPRTSNKDAAHDQKLERFQDAWVSRRAVSVEKRKKSSDPFKDFLSDDPRMEQLKLERTTEEGYIRSCKDALHHKAIMGKLDAEACCAEDHLNLPHTNSTPHTSNTKITLPPVKGLRKLQYEMMHSLKNVCESNQQAMGSFVEKHEEKRRHKQKETLEHNRHDSTSGSLDEFKNMLNAVEHSKTPKSKSMDLWKDGGATPFRNRYRKNHDQYMLENLDVAQAVQGYQAKRCKPTRKGTMEL